MAARFVNIDRDTPMLLPPDLRDWVPEDDPARLVVDLVESLDLATARINQRGCGSKQYPPLMMLALLLYSYSHGVFSSRQIEQMSYNHVGVRFICADHHPDHDTICTFRRQNAQLIRATFTESLRLAGEIGIVKVGALTVAMDGTKIAGNISTEQTLSIKQIDQQIEKLENQSPPWRKNLRVCLKKLSALIVGKTRRALPFPGNYATLLFALRSSRRLEILL